MTRSRVAVSDDHVSLFLISSELTKQCLALGRIETDRCFLGTGRSLVFGELPEQRLSLFRIERDLILHGRLLGSGSSPAFFNHCSAAGKRVHPETEAVMSNSRHLGRRAFMSLRLAKKA